MRRNGVFWIIQQFWFSSSVPLFCVIGTTKGLTCSSSFLWDPSRKNLSLQIYKSSWISLVAPPTVVSFGTTHFQTQIHQHSVTRWIKNIKRPFSYFNCSTSCLSLLHSVCWTQVHTLGSDWLLLLLKVQQGLLMVALLGCCDMKDQSHMNDYVNDFPNSTLPEHVYVGGVVV